MAKDRRKVSHIHSKIQDRQPTPASLEYGELGVNYNADHEFISMKNSNDKVVRFSSDEQLVTIMEKKEVMPYKGYVRGETGPSSTSGDSPTADARGSYGITNNDLLNNKSEIVVKLNQVAASATTKHDKVNGALDAYNLQVNPTTDDGLNDGAGFFIDMSRYAMQDANPSFSSITNTCKTTLSGTTIIRGLDGDCGSLLDVKVNSGKSDISTATTKIGTADTTVTSAKTAVNSATTNVTAATTTVGTADTTITSANTGIDTATTTIGTADTKITSAKTVVNTATTTVGTADTTITSAKTGINTATTNVTLANTTAGTANTNVTLANTTAGTANTNVTSAKTDITIATTTIGTADTKITSANTVITNATTNISAATTTISTANTSATTADYSGNTLASHINGVTHSGDTLVVEEKTSISAKTPTTTISGTNFTMNESNTTISSCTKVEIRTNNYILGQCDGGSGSAEFEFCDGYKVKSDKTEFVQCTTGGSFGVSANTMSLSGGSLATTTSGNTTINADGSLGLSSKGNLSAVSTEGDMIITANRDICETAGDNAAFYGATSTSVGLDCLSAASSTTTYLYGNTIVEKAATADTAITSAKTDISTATTTVGTADTTITSAKTNITSATTTVGTANTTVTSANTSINTATTNVTLANTTANTANTTVTSANTKITSATTNITAATTTIGTADTNITSAKTVITTANTSATTADYSGNTLNSHVKGVTHSGDTLSITESTSTEIKSPTTTISGTNFTLNETNTTINSCGKVEIKTNDYKLTQCDGGSGSAEFDFCGGYKVNSDDIVLSSCTANGGKLTVVESGTTITGKELVLDESTSISAKTPTTKVSGTTLEVNEANINMSASTGTNISGGTFTSTSTGNTTINASGNTAVNTTGTATLTSTGSTTIQATGANSDVCVNAKDSARLYGEGSTYVGVKCDGTVGSATTVEGKTLNVSGTTTNISGSTNLNLSGATIGVSGGTITETSTGKTCIQATDATNGIVNIGGNKTTNIGYDCDGEGYTDATNIYAYSSTTINSSATTISSNTTTVTGDLIVSGNTTISGDVTLLNTCTALTSNTVADALCEAFDRSKVSVSGSSRSNNNSTNMFQSYTVVQDNEGRTINIEIANVKTSGTTTSAPQTSGTYKTFDVIYSGTSRGTLSVPNVTITSTTTGLADGVLKEYDIMYDGVSRGKIEIPKDFLVKDGSVKVVTTPDEPYSGAAVGDKYIELVLNVESGSSEEKKIYIPAKDLIIDMVFSSSTGNISAATDYIGGYETVNLNMTTGRTLTVTHNGGSVTYEPASSSTSITLPHSALTIDYGVDVTSKSDDSYDTSAAKTVSIPTAVSHINRGKLTVTHNGGSVTFDPATDTSFTAPHSALTIDYGVDVTSKSDDSYDTSAAKTVSIPTSVSHINRGNLTITHNGSSTTFDPAIDTSFTAPHSALTIDYGTVVTGKTDDTYDTSAAKTVSIPTAVSHISRGTLSYSHNGYSGSFDPASNATFSSPHSALTIDYGSDVTGKTDDTYDTSAAKTVSIPTSVSNISRGNLTITHNGASTTFDPATTTSATLSHSTLTIDYGSDVTGKTDDTYDTSAAKTVSIPTSVSNISRGKFTITHCGSSTTFDPATTTSATLSHGTLTIQKNGTTVDTFDACSNKTINIEVPGGSATTYCFDYKYGDVRTAVSGTYCPTSARTEFYIPHSIEDLANWDGNCYSFSGPICVTDIITANGAIYSSDERLKENIADIGIDKIMRAKSIKLKSFNFKDDATKRETYGVIAQEVEKAGLVELVHLKDDGNLAVDYTSLLILKNAALEQEILNLRSELRYLYNELLDKIEGKDEKPLVAPLKGKPIKD